MKRTTLSERALILAPRGRDAPIAEAILREAGLAANACPSLARLVAELDAGAAFVVITEETLATADLAPLSAWLDDQQEWSDLPFVLLTNHGGGLERNPAAKRHLDLLGNVTFLERPFHPTTLVSLARSALRGRRRQYEARARLEALRVSEERYRTLFEAVDAGFCVVEMKFDAQQRPVDYRLAETNPAFARQTGLHNAAGKWISEVAPGLERHWFETYGRVALTGETVRFENHAEPLGRWYDVHAFRAGAPQERRVAILFNDITSRRNAEDRLRDLNESLEAQIAERTTERNRIWEMSRDLFAVMGFDGRLKAVNPAWTTTLGIDAATLLSLPFSEQVHPDDHEAAGAVMDALRRGETIERFEDRLRHADGSWRWISWALVPQGEVFYAVGRDVTAEKAAALELQTAQEALRQSQKMEAIGQLTGGVAHDFNNLLTVIRGSVDLLRRGTLPPERRERHLQAISDTVSRAARLTSQLLAFARRQTLQPEPVNVGANMTAISEMLATLTGSRIEIIPHIPAEPCFVNVDPSQFDTALVNMAVNARDAMDGEGTLTIEARPTKLMPAIRNHPAVAGDFVAVSLTDTGNGIPEDQLDHIFEPFFTTKAAGAGTGLGLSQVFGFAKQSGGEITVESRVGAGTTFTLYLPRVEAPGSAQAQREPEPAVEGNGTRVLLVEDNEEVGSFAEQALTDLGYVTVWALNAEEALGELEKDAERFDVVFSDVIMPGMNGIDLAQEIRRRHSSLPVVLTSGYSGVFAQGGTRGFELLHKPYSIEAMSEVLGRAANRRP